MAGDSGACSGWDTAGRGSAALCCGELGRCVAGLAIDAGTCDAGAVSWNWNCCQGTLRRVCDDDACARDDCRGSGDCTGWADFQHAGTLAGCGNAVGVVCVGGMVVTGRSVSADAVTPAGAGMVDLRVDVPGECV